MRIVSAASGPSRRGGRWLCSRQGSVQRAYMLPLGLLLPLVLSGCSVAGVDLSFNAKQVTRSTGRPAVVSGDRTAKAVPTPAFDLQAGNCPDAADQAIAMTAVSQRQGINLDMRLVLAPRAVGCGAPMGMIETYRARVTSASLSAFVIDGTWSTFPPAPCLSLLMDVLRRLHSLYPAAISRVVVYQADSVLGTVTLGRDNTPQVSCCTG